MASTLLSSRLLSLLKNGQWNGDDVVKLFLALVKQFNGTNEDFNTWMMKILYKVEIHKIKPTDLPFLNDGQFVEDVDVKINEIIEKSGDKTLDDIVEEITGQKNINKQVMAEVKDIVLSVSKSLSTKKRLDAIVKQICKQKVIDKQVMSEVKDLVLSVSTSLSPKKLLDKIVEEICEKKDIDKQVIAKVKDIVVSVSIIISSNKLLDEIVEGICEQKDINEKVIAIVKSLALSVSTSLSTKKLLDEIVEEICEEKDIDKQVMAEVKNIVLSVSIILSSKELQGTKQILFRLCKAVEKTMKMTPRLTQMVSWCLLVLSESSQLVQVGTGEGKSCIVAMFAAYQAMMGKTPDVISSSPVLAERDAKEWSEFYKDLRITVEVNTNKSKDSDLKKCYECQVVYGTTQSFAGDYLRQRFHRMDVRPKREFQCVIVDEVDSLMLDKGLEVVYLNTEMPFMESLNGILAEIWWVVSQLKHLDTGEILGPIQDFSQILLESIFENNIIDELIIVQMAVNAGIVPTTTYIKNQENKKSILKQLDNASGIQIVAFLTMILKKIPEYVFKLYLQGPDGNLQKLNEIISSDINTRQEMSVLLLECGQCRFVYSEDIIVTSLVKRFKKALSASIKEEIGSCIPGLFDLIDGKLQTWIENALKATKMTLGHEYILHGDGVVPVDYRCTGVVQNNMQWGDGLQQFLEMKHQTKLSNMSLITNFMSNVGLFRRYNNHVYGITGTLGDQTELDMLKKLYDGIETCKIPSFRCRKLYELEGLIVPEEEEWIREICNVVKEQVSSTVYRGPRAALVICETINRAEILYKTLVDTILKDKLKLYVNNNMDNSTIVDKTVQEGDVIIATNLAGRGTDLKICENVNNAGGLFVVQTFLPLNVRVEQQAFGRTARQGSPGSAQLIMCCSHFSVSVKSMMTLNTSLTSLHTTTISCGVTECPFERAVNCYQENPNFQNHKAMVSALTALLTLKPLPFGKNNLDKAKIARNNMVNARLSRFLEKDIPKITKKEELFSVYLDVLDDIYEKDCFSAQRDVIVSCLHECWGLWLLMHFSEEKSSDTLKQQLEVDLSSAKEKLLSKQSPSSMVYYYIRTGNNLRQNGHLAESIEMYTKAVEDSGYGDIIPQYNRALATITKKEAGYIAQALADLEKADEAIDSYKLHLAQIVTFVKLSSQEPTAENGTLFSRQFQVKAMALDLLKLNIQDAVMKLRRAESTGRNVRLTEKHTHFLVEKHIIVLLVCFSEVLKELVMEIVHIQSLGLDIIFSLDTQFSLSGFFSKILFD